MLALALDPTRAAPTQWTPALDGQLIRLRAGGATWELTAATLKLSLYTTIERGRRLNARRPPAPPRPPAPDLARGPLPPGHPDSWLAINAGTTNQGAPYPFPVFTQEQNMNLNTARPLSPVIVSLAQPYVALDDTRRDAMPPDAEYVIYRLEEAGRALLALPHTGYTTKLRSSSLDIVRGAMDAPAWTERQIRPAIPSAATITRMDQALCWIPLIPKDRYVLRRIVGARALVSPVTERYLYSWRRLASLIGADHKAIQRWHAQGIDMIVAAVNSQR